jgi:molybdenum transport protein
VIYIGDDVIERIIREDVPALDLTTWTLGLSGSGLLRCTTRTDVVVCGAEESARIATRLGARSAGGPESGTPVPAGGVVFEAVGDVRVLHQAWRACLKVLEGATGIATRTAGLVARAREGSADAQVLTSRKWFPGTRELAVKAAVVGGALPHRLGLSETLLVFAQHREFLGGVAGLLPRIGEMRARVPEKKLVVEVASLEEAVAVAAAGADGVQFDKVPPAVLGDGVARLRESFPGLVVLAAGGVTPGNARDYAATGVHGLVTSWVFHGPPADLGTEFIAD